ncbi:MAG: M48 family metallopeptidase [Deltaproteobacteria bacterium]|nr:M48 family metallopeptidase [Deltaproteobacteria bacterium]
MELDNIAYRVSYRGVKYPRLEFKTGELLFVLPYGYNSDELLKKHKSWILRKIEFIEDCLKNSSAKEIIERTDKELRDIVYSFAAKHSKELGLKLSNIYFREMRTKWASCSSKGNLTVNMLTKDLPAHLIEYVIFHEIGHLVERKHNDKFWGIVSKGFNNYQELEKDLFVYWFRFNNRV